MDPEERTEKYWPACSLIDITSVKLQSAYQHKGYGLGGKE